MKLTGNCLTVFIILLNTGCINLRQTDQSISNLSSVHQPKNNQQQELPDTLLNNLLAQHPQLFKDIISKKDEMGIQIIYTQIDRGKKEKDKIKFTDHTFNLNAGTYFYPASTVKLPVAILALQKLNELNIPGLDKYTTMVTGEDGEGQTEVFNDPSTPEGRPTIAHYIKKILLVSDDKAFNRLYEFLGQEYINTSLQRMGYKDVQIIHRLSISLTDEQNRHTNPVSFFDTGSKILYAKPAEKSKLIYAFRNTKLGNGYLKGGNLINEPFDFSKKNRMPLQYLHTIVRSIIFPDYVSKEQQFNLTKEDYDFLRRYMSMMPQECSSPVYLSPEYWDTYVKFLFYGSEPGKASPGIRIFNKVGDAYGFLIDAAYIVDYKNGIEFMLSAVIYCNSDGIFNDDKYDYAKVGFPFLKNLGKIVYEYEQTRVRKNKQLFSPISFNYIN